MALSTVYRYTIATVGIQYRVSRGGVSDEGIERHQPGRMGRTHGDGGGAEAALSAVYIESRVLNRRESKQASLPEQRLAAETLCSYRLGSLSYSHTIRALDQYERSALAMKACIRSGHSPSTSLHIIICNHL